MYDKILARGSRTRKLIETRKRVFRIRAEIEKLVVRLSDTQREERVLQEAVEADACETLNEARALEGACASVRVSEDVAKRLRRAAADARQEAEGLRAAKTLHEETNTLDVDSSQRCVVCMRTYEKSAAEVVQRCGDCAMTRLVCCTSCAPSLPLDLTCIICRGNRAKLMRVDGMPFEVVRDMVNVSDLHVKN